MIDGMLARGYAPPFAERSSTRSRASANTAFRKATPRASRCWSTPPAGSSATIPMSSPARCSMPSRWASMRRLRSCAMRIEHGVEVRPVDINASAGTPRWSAAARGIDRLHRATGHGRDIRSTHALRTGLPAGEGPARGRHAAPSSSGGARAMTACAMCGCARRLSPAVIERLADADAFRSLGLDRRAMRCGPARGLGRDGGQERPAAVRRQPRPCKWRRIRTRLAAACSLGEEVVRGLSACRCR
jgi:hypothetical protein